MKTNRRKKMTGKKFFPLKFLQKLLTWTPPKKFLMLMLFLEPPLLRNAQKRH
jgi:hypothetical protein